MEAIDSARVQRFDVLCSSDPSHVVHTGNTYLQDVAEGYLTENPAVRINMTEERVTASVHIIGAIRNHKGRFLAKTKRGTWKDVGNQLALRWVSLYLKRQYGEEGGVGGGEEI